MSVLEMFSWGYWGWGTATPQLVTATSMGEEHRGFAPPTFVDVRLKRAGRAPGFSGDAFEMLLGRRRYRWMPTLGNANIGTTKAARISCPAASDHLLDLALDSRERRSRVIFFCACESPYGTSCHRHQVARLVTRSARRRGIEIAIEEWPGGRPSHRPLELPVPLEVLAKISKGALAVPLNRARVPVALAALPWGTLLKLHAGKEELLAAVGPAAYRSGSWVLPLFTDGSSQAQSVDRLRRQAQALRRRLKLA